MSEKSSYKPLVFEHQPDAILNQAAPVQNTWYTVLEETNVRVNMIAISIATTGEDLEVQITRDGELDVCLAGVTVNPAASHRAYLATYNYGNRTIVGASGGTQMAMINSFFEARSVKIEVRKVTANGAGNLSAAVDWDKMT